ncbi:uncharacterized protein LOC130498082 [Raphanus sativus]|uniref:Uncharacterized protein LOC130498082 n=1 Tax=Raphanus sativus TaxID=3726 RepID=A0A9W3C7N6_RAPSA|nr:uncharacterized protein LOC130498082 [Raphanus sativus]
MENTWFVHVKVLHAWRQTIQSVDTMEFVLVDETVSPAGGAYRTTNHAWKIVFNQNTSITRSNHSNDELYLDLVDFQTVLSGTLDDNLLIDVLGQVVDCGEVETIQCAGGKQRKKLDLILSDIKINADEKFLTSFMSNEDSHEDNNKQVSLSGKRGNRDKWLLFPSKSIQEMITSTQIDRCLVRCTVYAIDIDWSWYYFGCKACNKKVIKTGTQVKKLNVQEIVTHSWWCETCKDTVFEVSPRFWLHLMINDDTGLEDPTLLPECITDLIGKDFTFGVYVEKENVAYGAEIYKVGKIYKDKTPSVSNVITTGQDNKPLSITYVDEDSHDISESQETANAISTLSIKRKEEETNEQGDLSSTSKKPCIRLIKLEKVEQAKKND